MRITHLAETLASLGFETHLLFIGDPNLPGRETLQEGLLTLHRWCQWISAYHPAGVYDGEEGKLHDFNASVPPFLLQHFIRPTLESGRFPVILAEEWHTAEALIRLQDLLEEEGLARQNVMFWNANNTMSFHRVNWERLSAVAQLTTVSRYMKHIMLEMGVNPLVIPNGIPASLLGAVNERQIAELGQVLNPDRQGVFFFKVGRFDPAKRWITAIEAAAQLKTSGYRVVFPLRGGIEPHGAEVLGRARELGLSVSEVTGQPESWSELIALLAQAPRSDIYNLRFFMSQQMLRPFYALADATLANSGHEPFGLVGLEAMAARGIVFTGSTGEEYTLCNHCAIPLDTSAPAEIISQVLSIKANGNRAHRMRKAAHRQASSFTWEKVTDTLLNKLQFVSHWQGALPRPGRQQQGRERSGIIEISDIGRGRTSPALTPQPAQ